jgi:FtsH-binding integral membrane protein
VAGAIALYTDIVGLFLHLLRLFGEREDPRAK